MPRYVILEHSWDGVHWDFMLEVDGTLRTWALDAPPVRDVRIPARELAHHRMTYLDYEGPVSNGRGSVRRVDRGHYDVLSVEPDSVVVRLFGGVWTGTAEVRRTGDAETGWTFRLGNVD